MCIGPPSAAATLAVVAVGSVAPAARTDQQKARWLGLVAARDQAHDQVLEQDLLEVAAGALGLGQVRGISQEFCQESVSLPLLGTGIAVRIADQQPEQAKL